MKTQTLKEKIIDTLIFIIAVVMLGVSFLISLPIVGTIGFFKQIKEWCEDWYTLFFKTGSWI